MENKKTEVINQDINNSRILIVDDNVKNLQVLGGFLQGEGFVVEFALDGESALDWIGRGDFDLILLDIMMPGIDGYEVCRRIKENPLHKQLPVIFLTAKNDQESIIEGFSIGAVDYITKPFIRAELLARVKTHLEIKHSRDRLASLLRQLEEKNRDITSSIEYAKNIQEAMLRTSEPFKSNFPDHFILYIPKDIVSGDFYWFKTVDHTHILAIMDCTGHGVPGALMSSIGVTLLNEIVSHERVFRPDLILGNLRSKLVATLGQETVSATIKDSIEGSVFSFDTLNHTYSISGSGNSMIVIHRGVLEEIKPPRMPIGLSDKRMNYLNVDLSISPGDMIYMFTDGFIDQFGGPASKRYLIKRFKEKLQSLYTFPLEVQREMLREELVSWKAENMQTDDILVLGIRL